MARIALVGEGVIGLSTALAIQKLSPSARLTIYSADPFESTCSYGPAGLFRVDNIGHEVNRKYAKETHHWFSSLCRKFPGSLTGVKLLSGHIQSDDKKSLEMQELANKDLVYNFRWLTDKEIKDQFENPAKYCVHFSAFGAEGQKYVPFLRDQLKDVQIINKKVEDLDELGEQYDVVVNCAGLQAGKLAGDDDNMFPIRGIVLEVKAPWHKHFLYRDFDTFTIPKENVVALGSVKQQGNFSMTATKDEIEEIMERYCRLQPAMREAEIQKVWCHLRPARKGGIRLEKQTKTTKSGKEYTVIHNYGHGGSGFTLGWGTALEAAKMFAGEVIAKAKL
ncbi:unnamed protein product [Auanema sp. JU1783]|nr:unnamed protein product [Auanema sp. JU1783]